MPKMPSAHDKSPLEILCDALTNAKGGHPMEGWVEKHPGAQDHDEVGQFNNAIQNLFVDVERRDYGTAERFKALLVRAGRIKVRLL